MNQGSVPEVLALDAAFVVLSISTDLDKSFNANKPLPKTMIHISPQGSLLLKNLHVKCMLVDKQFSLPNANQRAKC